MVFMVFESKIKIMSKINTKRLSDQMNTALNDQMTKEAHASQTYLAYGAWASMEGYDGTANFLFRHAHEERNHMMKILEYILDRGGEVKIASIPAADKLPKNMQDCFEKVFQQEVDNTKSIYKVVKKSMDEEDWATWNFMQWFVKEQIEEETLSMNLLDKVKIAGGEKATDEALYALDRQLEHTPDEARGAEEVTTENP